MELDKIYLGDSLTILNGFKDESIDMIITSPPYWALRDYGEDGQLGLEKTFNDYINRLCDIFDECRRVLKNEGTCWVNLGDTYIGSPAGNKKASGFQQKSIEKSGVNYNPQYADPKLPQRLRAREQVAKQILPNKSLAQIPSRFAIEMCNRGWILRNEIIWHKPNAMPSSVKDRFSVDFEKLFFFVKDKKYYFEQQLEPVKEISIKRAKYGWHGTKLAHGDNYAGLKGTEAMGDRYCNPKGRNKRSVWSVPTKGFKGAHFATYPEKLIETPILAGCPENGIVLDPFMGSGTTAIVSKRLNRNYVGIELNKEYIKIANKRINEEKIHN